MKWIFAALIVILGPYLLALGFFWLLIRRATRGHKDGDRTQ